MHATFVTGSQHDCTEKSRYNLYLAVFEIAESAKYVRTIYCKCRHFTDFSQIFGKRSQNSKLPKQLDSAFIVSNEVVHKLASVNTVNVLLMNMAHCYCVCALLTHSTAKPCLTLLLAYYRVGQKSDTSLTM